MRWPGWLLRRAPDENSSPHVQATTPGPVERAWRALPPIQRTLEAPATVVAPEAFVACLSTRQDPRFLQPLAHNVLATAPSGQVEGVATVAPATVQRTLYGAPRVGSPGPRPLAASAADASEPAPSAPKLAPAEPAEAEAATAAPIEPTVSVPAPHGQSPPPPVPGAGSPHVAPDAGPGRFVQRRSVPEGAAAQTAHRQVPAPTRQVQRTTGRIVSPAAPAEPPTSPPVAEAVPVLSVDWPGVPNDPFVLVEPRQVSAVDPVQRAEPSEPVQHSDLDAPTPVPEAEPSEAALVGSGEGPTAPPSEGPAGGQAAIQRAVDPTGLFDVPARHAAVEVPLVPSSAAPGSGSASSGAQPPLGRQHPDAAAGAPAPAEPQGPMSDLRASQVTSLSAPAPPALQRSLISASTPSTERSTSSGPALPTEPSLTLDLLGERPRLAALDPTAQTLAAEAAYPPTSRSTPAHRKPPAAPSLTTRTLPLPPIPLSVSRVPLEEGTQTSQAPVVQRVSFRAGDGGAGRAEPAAPNAAPGPAHVADRATPPPSGPTPTSASTSPGWRLEASSPAVPVQRLAEIAGQPGPTGYPTPNRPATATLTPTVSVLQRVLSRPAAGATADADGGRRPSRTIPAAEPFAGGSGFTVVDLPSGPDLLGVQRLAAPRPADQSPDRPTAAAANDTSAAGSATESSLLSVQANPELQVQAAAAAAPAALSEAAGADNLDELAQRLYEPLSARLRAELWLDRERSGRSLTR